MKVKWLGHATFLITAENGTKIITDPYKTNESLKYDDIKESADIVTVSHEHGDHNYVEAITGNPEVVRGTAEVKGISFKGIPSYHDDSEGSQRGSNTIFCFKVDGVQICHLGDLGHPLRGNVITDIGRPDVLLIPVGGNYTLGADGASEVVRYLLPRNVIPMHYNNDRCPDFPVAGVDDFLKRKPRITRPDSSEVEFKGEPTDNVSGTGWPAHFATDLTKVIVLKPAL